MRRVEGVGKPIAALRSCGKDRAFGPGRGALVRCDPNEAEAEKFVERIVDLRPRYGCPLTDPPLLESRIDLVAVAQRGGRKRAGRAFYYLRADAAQVVEIDAGQVNGEQSDLTFYTSFRSHENANGEGSSTNVNIEY